MNKYIEKAIREDLIRLQNSINECIDDLAIARDRKDDGDELIALRRMEALLGDVNQTCISVLFSLKEEPVSDDVWEASKKYALRQVLASTDEEMSEQSYLDLRLFSGLELAIAHKDGANWKEQQLEKNRLAHCDELTEEQAKIESDFVTQHFKKNNRTPTFIDAIEHGMKSQIEQIMTNAKQGTVQEGYQIFLDDGSWIDLDPSMQLKPAFNVNVNDKVKVIVTKED